jgi:hypothetical protein
MYLVPLMMATDLSEKEKHSSLFCPGGSKEEDGVL